MTYVRTPAGKEVDFLARTPDGTEELIQVSAEVFDPAVAEREIRGLVEAGRDVSPRPQAAAHPDRRTTPARPHRRRVIVQPAYEWMLENPGSVAERLGRPD